MNDMNRDTPAWRFQVWASFVIAIAATTVGIAYLPVPVWIRGYVGLAMLFSVGSSFTLAKTVRDEHEAKRLLTKIESAQAERILRDLGGDEDVHAARKVA
ncbi:MAG: YiaA/YiaB family inner membrane protein [Myxococcota bacterium]